MMRLLVAGLRKLGLGVGWGFPTVGGHSIRKAKNRWLSENSLLFHLPPNILYLSKLPARALHSEEIASLRAMLP